MKTIKSLAHGFTLIELLIVLSLISVLAAFAVGNFRSAQMRGRDAVRKSDLRNIQTALRLYYNDYGRYPASSPLAGGLMVACGTTATAASCTYGLAWARGGTTYMSVLPDDPQVSNNDYVYTYVNDDDYTLRSCLEARNDPKGVAVSTAICSSGFKYEVRP